MNKGHLLLLPFILFYATLGSAFAAAQALSVNLVPVKADMLDGSRLVLKDAGCSVDLPSGDWKWKTYEGSTQNYLCEQTNTHALFLVSVGVLHGDLTDHQPKSLIDLASKSFVARGEKLENDKYDWIEMPGVKKCVRVQFNNVDKAGKKTLAVIYIMQTVGQVTVKFQYQGPTANEPDPYNKMVHSLKVLGDNGADTKTTGKTEAGRK